MYLAVLKTNIVSLEDCCVEDKHNLTIHQRAAKGEKRNNSIETINEKKQNCQKETLFQGTRGAYGGI